MSTGKQHALASLVTASVTSVLGFLSGEPLLAVGTAAGAVSGILLSPDLDVDQYTYSDYTVRRFAGELAAWGWRLLWFPYRKLIPHRSWLSHAPLLGTAGRVGYVGLFVGFLLGWDFTFVRQNLPFWMSWLAGLMLADVVHYAMDGLPGWSSTLHRN